MKQLLLIAFFETLMSLAFAQEAGKGIFDQLSPDAVVITERGHFQGPEEIQTYVSGFSQSNGGIQAYNKTFTKEVKAPLEYEMGEIKTKKGIFYAMFVKQTDPSTGTKIELLTVYPKAEAPEQNTSIEEARQQWMELCNAHQASALVSRLYTPGAYYYNRGRLLQGTAAITQEYQYMNNPNYSLKLTPLQVEIVSPGIVYEIGQCSGSYSLPYMLLWEKQQNGKWQVLMDTNY